MNVGKVGMPVSNPSPTSQVIQQALNLCIAFGADKGEFPKMLAEMKRVQTHNEKVLKSAQDAIHDAEEVARIAEKARLDSIDACSKAEAKIASREAKLRSSIDSHAEVMKVHEANAVESENHIAKMNRDLSERTRRIEAREQEVREKTRSVEKLSSKLERKLEKISKTEEEWNTKMASLKAIASG